MNRRLRGFFDPDSLLDSPILASPLLALRQMQEEMNRLFETQGSDESGAYPPVNVWVGTDGAIVFAELAGVDPQSLDVSTRGNTLTLKGERKAPEASEREQWVRRERPFGAFSRIVELPFAVNADKVEAHYKNGVLKISLPRAEESKPRKIEVHH